MRASIFKSGSKSAFAKNSRRMARMVSIGAGSLAVVFCLFIFFYFESNEFVKNISCVLPVIYFGSIIMTFTKVTNRTLYNFIFYIYIFTSYLILIIAYQLSFNPAFLVLMLTAFNVILFAIPKPKQILIYFAAVFIPLVFTTFLSSITIGLSILISISFGYVFLLSYVISQQKQKLNLRSTQNSEILKTLVNNASDAIFLVDFFSKNIWDANEKTKDLFGFDDIDEVISKNYYSLFADENFINEHRNRVTLAITQDGYFQDEVLFKKKIGSEFWGNILISPFKAVNNNYYLIQIKNIDDKKKHADEILANNDKFKFILNNLEDFIYLVSYNNAGKEKFEYISPYIENLFGLTEDEYVSNEMREKLNEIYHPADFPKLKQLKEDLLTTKSKVSTTYRAKPIGKDNYITIHETVIPRLNEAGEIEQLLGILKEVDKE